MLFVKKTNAMFAIRIFTDYYLDVPAMPNVWQWGGADTSHQPEKHIFCKRGGGELLLY